MKCCCSAHRAGLWTISRARSRWRKGRPSGSIACRSPSLPRVLRQPSWQLAEKRPASGLGHEAVAARAAFEAAHDEALEYFAPVSSTPGFPKALARTLLELRLAGVASAPLGALRRSGRDLAELLDRVDTLMSEAGTSDRASLFATATKALRPMPSALSGPMARWHPCPATARRSFRLRRRSGFLWALIEQAGTETRSPFPPATRDRSPNFRNAG